MQAFFKTNLCDLTGSPDEEDIIKTTTGQQQLSVKWEWIR